MKMHDFFSAKSCDSSKLTILPTKQFLEALSLKYIANLAYISRIDRVTDSSEKVF